MFPPVGGKYLSLRRIRRNKPDPSDFSRFFSILFLLFLFLLCWCRVSLPPQDRLSLSWRAEAAGWREGQPGGSRVCLSCTACLSPCSRPVFRHSHSACLSFSRAQPELPGSAEQAQFWHPVAGTPQFALAVWRAGPFPSRPPRTPLH